VRGKRDRDPVRLQVEDLESKVSVVTLKTDLQYWPTYELRRSDQGWERTSPLDLDGLATGGAKESIPEPAPPAAAPASEPGGVSIRKSAEPPVATPREKPTQKGDGASLR